MILPASYSNGFAPRDGQPLYPELWRGCVGAWNPGLGPTGLTLRDWSGYGRYATLNNDPVYAVNGAKYAISCDGTNDYIRIPRFADYSTLLTTKKTTSIWVRTSSPGSSYRTVWSQDRCFAVTIKDSVFITYDWAAASDRSSGVNIADGAWHHLAITFNPGVSSGSEFFIDGQKVGSSFTYSSQAGSNDMDMSIGTALTTAPLNQPAAEYVNAAVDDPRLYYGLLSSNTIRLLASRRGIAYEMAPRRRSSSAVQFNRRRRLLLGAS